MKRFALFLVLLLTLCACAPATPGESSTSLEVDSSAEADTPTATDITLDITSHKMDEDSTQSLTATLSPAGAKEAITWTSSNPEVATVNKKGKVSGVAGGTATITAATTSGLTATCEIEVLHSYELTAVRESSCLTDGFERYTCSGCGHSYDKYLPAVGGQHRWFTDYCTRCGISPRDYSQVTPFTNTGYPEYERLIAEYAFSLALGYDEIYTFAETCTDAHGGVCVEVPFMAEELFGPHLHYSIHDIDANGTPELLIDRNARATPEEWNELGSTLIVYGLNADKKATFLGYGINRSQLIVLTDGRLLESSSTARTSTYNLYRVIENGEKRLIEAFVYDEYGPEEASAYIEEGYTYVIEKEWSRRFNDLKADSVMHELTWIAIN